MIRFGFQIRTKTGQRIDSISIIAASHPDAERRLRQMYHQCEILGCREQEVAGRAHTGGADGVSGWTRRVDTGMASLSVQETGTG